MLQLKVLLWSWAFNDTSGWAAIAYTSFERFWADTSFKLSSEDLV